MRIWPVAITVAIDGPKYSRFRARTQYMCFAVTPADIARSKLHDNDAPGVDDIEGMVEIPTLERSHGPHPL